MTLSNLTTLKYELNFSPFRARKKYFEQGNKAGTLLVRYIKPREAQNTIAAIRTEGGVLTRDPTEVNKIFRAFYATLYLSETQAEQQEIQYMFF